MLESHVLNPKPSSLVASLRDIGYSIETAIADTVDNSITAEARNIHIEYDWNDGDPWLAVVDDGHGMAREALIEAMRFGSSDPRAERAKDDLGRFGLGMKTAAISQCTRLTVFSKQSGKAYAAVWDLGEMAASPSTDWTLQLLDEPAVREDGPLSQLLPHYLDGRPSGTIVLWQDIDRIGAGDPPRERESALNRAIDRTRAHLELVFHRNLKADRGQRRVVYRTGVRGAGCWNDTGRSTSSTCL